MKENEYFRREQNILERLESVKRLIQMETTLMTSAQWYSDYRKTDRAGKVIGDISNTLLNDLRDDIQLQLLSVTALCYGDNPDLGEPFPMLEWTSEVDGKNSYDTFHDVWDKCLIWNA